VLIELAVSDLGVIDDLSLVLGPGMTALTGETGAGKTMVVGAIELLTGARADASMVRPGSDEATVEGRFVVEDRELVLTRVVPRDGRSRAYRDGRLVTAAALAEETATLVDLHGQHTHVALLTTASQRRALDRFANVDLGALAEARAAVAAADRVLTALGGDAAARTRELEFLRYQLDELEAAGLTDAGEDDRLAAEEAVLGDADAHRDAALAAEASLATDGGARDLLSRALVELASRPPFAELEARVQSVVADLDEVARDLRRTAEGIEADPERLAAVQARRLALTELRRRYTGNGRGPLGELFTARDELAARLAELESHDERARTADAQRALALEEQGREEARVGAQRRGAAPGLAAAIETRLHDLALGKARFAISVDDTDPGDAVRFELAANPGLPLAPLAKAASGGELARTMLAIRLVVGASAPTLVFDEVDAGVGGEAARAVGRALAALADRSQVLVVTHLPQVAAFADAQVALTKHDDGTTTAVRAEELAGTARVRELSRMLSGLPGSDSGQEHAEELLVTAAQERGRS
jgi:DNA repair protein RecN (Recombination protein N)